MPFEKQAATCPPFNALVCTAGLTVTKVITRHCWTYDMVLHSPDLPKTGYALEIDGRIKTEFSTKEGAERGAIELKRRFPTLQIRVYDAETQSRHEVHA
jgi:hypothetical protein